MKSSLFPILTVFFILLFTPLALEKLFNQTVTGRGLVVSLALVLGFTAWRWIQARRTMRAAEQDARLRRRALLHLIGNERGEVAGPLLVACMFFLACMSMAVQLCAAEPVHIDRILTEATEQLFPAVPLSAQELSDLQAVALAVAVVSKQLQSVPSEMTSATREKRFAMRRDLEKVHGVLVEAMVQHAGSVIMATRKGAK